MTPLTPRDYDAAQLLTRGYPLEAVADALITDALMRRDSGLSQCGYCGLIPDHLGPCPAAAETVRRCADGEIARHDCDVAHSEPCLVCGAPIPSEHAAFGLVPAREFHDDGCAVIADLYADYDAEAYEDAHRVCIRGECPDCDDARDAPHTFVPDITPGPSPEGGVAFVFGPNGGYVPCALCERDEPDPLHTVLPRDPYDVYGTPEHEWLLMEEEHREG